MLKSFAVYVLPHINVTTTQYRIVDSIYTDHRAFSLLTYTRSDAACRCTIYEDIYF